MRKIIPRRFGAMLFLAALTVVAASIAGAGQRALLAVDSNHLAIKGYDPVAYFTDAKAVKGDSRFEYVYDEATWQFATAAHRDMFVADPDHYMPQYGGFCAACVEMKLCAGLTDLAPGRPGCLDYRQWQALHGREQEIFSPMESEFCRKHPASGHPLGWYTEASSHLTAMTGSLPGCGFLRDS